MLLNYTSKIRFQYNINTIMNVKKLLIHIQQLSFLRLKLLEILIVYSRDFAEKKLCK